MRKGALAIVGLISGCYICWYSGTNNPLFIGAIIACNILAFCYLPECKVSVSMVVEALCFVLLFSIGWSIQNGDKKSVLYDLLIYMEVFVFLYDAIYCLESRVITGRTKWDPFNANDKGAIRETKLKQLKHYWIYALVLVVGWLPYLICNYPGSVSNDAKRQLAQMLGFRPFENHNPIFDTVVYGMLFKLGKGLWGSDQIGIVCIIAFQYILMVFAVTYSLSVCYRITKSKIFVYVACLFFAFVPMFGGAGQVVLKDSLHFPLYMLLLCCITELIIDYNWHKLPMLFFLLCLVALTRAMAHIYAMVSSIGLLLYYVYQKRKGKYAVGFVSLLLIAFLTVFYTLFLPRIAITSYPKQEKYALPFQQVAYVVSKHNVTKEDEEAINSILDVKKIRSDYNANKADPVKKLYHEGNERIFWNYYFSLYKRYPIDMAKGVCKSYYKYFYPPSAGANTYRTYIAKMDSIGLNVYSVFPSLKEKLKGYVKYWNSNAILKWLMGPGLYCWIMIALVFTAVRFRAYEALVVYLPSLILLVGLLFTPVNGETRYAFPIIASIPLNISALFVNGKMKNSPSQEETSI